MNGKPKIVSASAKSIVSATTQVAKGSVPVVGAVGMAVVASVPTYFKLKRLMKG